MNDNNTPVCGPCDICERDPLAKLNTEYAVVHSSCLERLQRDLDHLSYLEKEER